MSGCQHWHRRGDTCLLCHPPSMGLDAAVTPAAAAEDLGWPEAWPQAWGASEGAPFPVRELEAHEVDTLSAWQRIEAHSRLVNDRLGTLVGTVAYSRMTMVERQRHRAASLLRLLADRIEPRWMNS